MAEQTNKTSIAALKPPEVEPQLAAPLALTSGYEMAVASVAARAKAMIEAHYVIALRQPRIPAKVRQDILAECARPGFARNKSTYYVKPIGDGVEGLGIRFAEAAVRCMKNVLVENVMLYEDAEKEVHGVRVIDLEANLPYATEVRVSKYVERQKLAEGQVPISVRKNSWGKNVYTVIGTEDDLLNKRGAAISKAMRTLILRIVPGDIQDDSEALIKKIRLDEAAQDPTAEQKLIADSFHELNVPVDQLIAFLGHSLETCSPAELVRLRGIYGAIRDGEATWAEVMENKAAAAPPKDETKPPKVDTKPHAGKEKPHAGSPPAETATVAEKGKLQAETDATVVPAAGQTVATPEGDRGPAQTGDLLGQGAPAPEPRKPRPPRKRAGTIE